MNFPNISSSSKWTDKKISEYLLHTKIPCRLACITKEDCAHVMSLWYLFQEGCIYCSVQEKTLLVSWLRDNPQCGFEIAADQQPYKGVRGRGVAQLLTGQSENILPLLINRYLGSCESPLAQKLLSRPETEVIIRINPNWLTSWDFSARMKG